MVNLSNLESKFNSLTSELNSLEGKCSLLSEQVSNSNKKLNELSGKKLVYQKSIELLTFLSELTKQQTKEGFDSLITYALRYVFGEDYKFQLNYGRRGNYEEIDFDILPPDRTEAADPMDSMGGGVIDVVSLALRIVLLELCKPKNTMFLALDEPAKHLSFQYRPKVGEFFKYISKKTNRQLLIVTHFEELKDYADKSIKVGE